MSWSKTWPHPLCSHDTEADSVYSVFKPWQNQQNTDHAQMDTAATTMAITWTFPRTTPHFLSLRPRFLLARTLKRVCLWEIKPSDVVTLDKWRTQMDLFCHINAITQPEEARKPHAVEINKLQTRWITKSSFRAAPLVRLWLKKKIELGDEVETRRYRKPTTTTKQPAFWCHWRKSKNQNYRRFRADFLLCPRHFGANTHHPCAVSAKGIVKEVLEKKR